MGQAIHFYVHVEKNLDSGHLLLHRPPSDVSNQHSILESIYDDIPRESVTIGRRHSK